MRLIQINNKKAVVRTDAKLSSCRMPNSTKTDLTKINSLNSYLSRNNGITKGAIKVIKLKEEERIPLNVILVADLNRKIVRL
jgi:hypothetical protein